MSLTNPAVEYARFAQSHGECIIASIRDGAIIV